MKIRIPPLGPPGGYCCAAITIAKTGNLADRKPGSETTICNRLSPRSQGSADSEGSVSEAGFIAERVRWIRWVYARAEDSAARSDWAAAIGSGADRMAPVTATPAAPAAIMAAALSAVMPPWARIGTP